MKKIFTLLSSLLICAAVWSQPTLAKWTFEGVTTTNTGTSPTFSVGSAVADQGVLTAGSSFTGVHSAAATTWSNPVGNASVKAVSGNTWTVNDYYQFQLSTTGYSGISVSVDHNGSGTGPANFKIQYSTDGTNFTDNGNYTIPASVTWNGTTPQPTTTFTFSFSAITALNNKPTVYFRLVNTTTTSISGGTVGTGGTSRVDNITVTGFTIFPLNLLSFNASLNGNSVNIAWATTNEVNVSGFEIERSVNGKDFSSIVHVAAKGSTVSNNYTYTDERAVGGVSYYRLRMNDKDGSFKYGPVVTIKTKSAGVSIYPNPVKSTLTIQHELAEKGATITVLSITGKQLFTMNVEAGASQTSIDAADLKPGSYMVVYMNNGVKLTKQFIKE